MIQDADPQRTAEFEDFVRESEPKLRFALGAAYGFEEGRDATAEAFAYALEHWERVRQMPNALGYLFRVAQSRSRRRRVPVLYDVAGWPDHLFEPGLPGRWRPCHAASAWWSFWCTDWATRCTRLRN